MKLFSERNLTISLMLGIVLGIVLGLVSQIQPDTADFRDWLSQRVERNNLPLELTLVEAEPPYVRAEITDPDRAPEVSQFLRRLSKKSYLTIESAEDDIVRLRPVSGLKRFIDRIAILGKLFISALKMVVVPLVLFSVTAGVANLHGTGEVGRKLGKTLGYYLCTSFLAVLTGIVVANVIRPGAGLNAADLKARLPANLFSDAQATQQEVSLRAPETVMEFLSIQIDNIFMNPFRSLAEMNLIGVVAFSMLLGVMIILSGDRGGPARRFFDSMNEAMMRMVQVVIWIAPVGVFALAANLISELGADILAPLLKYFLAVIAGLAFHWTVNLPLILKFICNYSWFKFLKGMQEALLLAVSTASSSATLPVTLRCAEEHVGVDSRSANFVLPMGATINMDGTALYEAMAAMFVAQVLGIELTILQQAMVFFTATLAAIGAAGIPQAGLVTMVIVFTAIGIPLEFMALIIVVDRPLDHLRTMVNVTGDAVGSVFLSYTEGELERAA